MADNGLGIAAQHHEQVFDVFTRLHTEEAYPGTGIGLAIARKAARAMGGDISLHSTPGSGSTFSLHLPAAAEGGSSHVRRIPVIVLTSSREESDRALSYDNGANSYLLKPVSLDGFLAALAAIHQYWLTLNLSAAPGADVRAIADPVLDRRGTSKQVPLAELRAERRDRVRFRLRLDPLGDQPATGGTREVAHADHHGLAADIAVDIPHEPDVDLHEVGPQVDDVGEVGDAGTGVIHRESRVRADPANGDPQLVVVGDGLMLGDLGDDRPTPALTTCERSGCATSNPGDRLTLSHRAGGSADAVSTATRSVAISSSGPSPTDHASANTRSGRSPDANRVSAS